MPRENWLTAVMTQLARVPDWLQRKRPFSPPQKLLVLQPDGLANVLLTTPLLTALRRSFPQAQIDWAITEPVRAVLTGNPHITNLLPFGDQETTEMGWFEYRQLVPKLRAERYDTCVVPEASSWLAWLAWRSDIPQRVGLQDRWQGFGYIASSQASGRLAHQTEQRLTLIPAMGLPQSRTLSATKMTFYPSDLDRTAVTQRLVDTLDWLGDTSLLLINPSHRATEKGWPLERFVLLINRLVKAHNCKVIVVGNVAEQETAQALTGLTATAIADWTGVLTLGQLGALCEVADLYIGNDVDLAYVAVASDCPTVVIYEKQPFAHTPYAPRGNFTPLWPEPASDEAITVSDAFAASQQLLQ